MFRLIFYTSCTLVPSDLRLHLVQLLPLLLGEHHGVHDACLESGSLMPV